MTMINAYQPGKVPLTDAERELLARRERALGPAYRLFYEHPVHFVRGEGVWLYDSAGNAYLDVYNNVPSVGHCHPHVVAAIARQAAQLNTHTRYLGDTIVDYAEALLRHFPPELSHVMFTCTGSEANDLAYRITEACTGGSGFIVTDLAYHGTTKTIAALSPSLGTSVPLGEHVRTVAPPDRYRANGNDVGRQFAAAVQAAIDDLRRHGIRPAALLVDTIFSSDGVFADPPGFLREAVDVIHAAGGLFIADEVQPGFGRIGSHMWGFARHGVLPDIVTMGKPMGAGHPIAGISVQPRVIAEFAKARYFNTFGGNAVSAAAGHAVLEVIEREGLMRNAQEVGDYLLGALRQLAARHPLIGDVRGAGLFIGVELVRDRQSQAPAGQEALALVNGLRERRILISASGPHANILKIRPPLVFSRSNADQFIESMDAVLKTLRAPNA